MKHIIMVGNPVDGLEFHGPFNESEDASEWADGVGFKESWWVVDLQEPENLEPPEEAYAEAEKLVDEVVNQAADTPNDGARERLIELLAKVL